jgi:hypothetical protein
VVTALGNNNVQLLLDCGPEGDEGAKDALWKLAQQRVDVHLGWSQEMTRRRHGMKS